MKKTSVLKVACVDYRQWYSPYLLKSLSRFCPSLKSCIYLPKSRQTTLFCQQKKSNLTDPSNSSKVWSTFSYPFDIFKKAQSDKIDLVHIQWEFNEFGIFYASLLLPFLLLFLRIGNKKCVTTIHSVIPRFSFRLKLPGFTLPKGSQFFVESGFILLYKMVVSLSNAVIVHGESLKVLLCRDYKSKQDKVFVIPYGIPSDYFPQSSSKFDATLDTNSEMILALGAVSPRKGLDTLIKAFKKVSAKSSSWTLIIAGRVPPYYQYYYENLKQLAPDLIKEKRIVFLGEFSLQDTTALIQKSKVIVFPYIYNFGASSTLTFALQHRKIVVISALNFAKDLLMNRQNALLIPPENPNVLAEAIELSMTDYDLRRTIESGVEHLLQKSCWDFVAEETLKVYSTVLSVKQNN